MSEVLLKAENVSIVFGGLKAVSDFDFYKIGRASCRERV